MGVLALAVRQGNCFPNHTRQVASASGDYVTLSGLLVGIDFQSYRDARQEMTFGILYLRSPVDAAVRNTFAKLNLKLGRVAGNNAVPELRCRAKQYLKTGTRLDHLARGSGNSQLHRLSNRQVGA